MNRGSAILVLLFVSGCVSTQKSVQPRKNKWAKQKETSKTTPVYKNIKDMNYVELVQSRHAYGADAHHAIPYVERMLALCSDPVELKELRLEIAELQFTDGNLEKAEQAYREYSSYYPGSEDLEYAQYKEILCAFYQTLESDRDQTKAKEALNKSGEFLAQSLYHTYADDVHIIQQQCKRTIFDSEVHVFNFYLDQDKLPAAENRLAYMKEHYADDLQLQRPIIQLEALLAQKQGNITLFKEKEALLAQYTPEKEPVNYKSIF